MDNMDNAKPPGKYREVGRRRIPDDHVYPMRTEQEREDYYEKLFAMKARDAVMMPVYRVMAQDEPRVKRFHTLEEANADQLDGMIKTAQAMRKRSIHVYR